MDLSSDDGWCKVRKVKLSLDAGLCMVRKVKYRWELNIGSKNKTLTQDCFVPW